MTPLDTVSRVRAACARDLPLVEVWGQDVAARLEAQWASFEGFLAGDPGPVYAVTTLTGHRDGADGGLSPLQINQAIADSHYLEPRSAPDERLWCLVGLCKLRQLALGGTPLRPTIFQALADTLETDAVGRIDLDASYSSGDVIPATQWALQSLAFAGLSVADLKAGEMIALINGDFVHLGSALWAVDTVEHMRARNDRQAHHAQTLLRDSGRYADRQAPVSFRAMNDVSRALNSGVRQTLMTVDRLLGAPSGNPLFFEGKVPRVESQASFLATDLSIVQGSVIEGCLALAWIVSRRIQHLCEAYDDGSTPGNPIALIQRPKLAEARLEGLRMRHGVRAFASGGAMSEGVEDFWTRGLMSSTAMSEVAAGLMDILSIEADVIARLDGLRSAP